MAIAHGTAQHRGACQTVLSRGQYNRLIERLALKAMIFANEDTQEHSVFWKLHDYLPFFDKG
jgi:hypothetical protein